MHESGRTSGISAFIQAKYKVVSHPDQEDDLLYYCFNCAVPLVKQGFKIEELTSNEKQRLSTNRQRISQQGSGRLGSNGGECSRMEEYGSNGRMKLGQQIKCKIIPRINKLKAGR